MLNMFICFILLILWPAVPAFPNTRDKFRSELGNQLYDPGDAHSRVRRQQGVPWSARDTQGNHETDLDSTKVSLFLDTMRLLRDFLHELNLHKLAEVDRDLSRNMKSASVQQQPSDAHNPSNNIRSYDRQARPPGLPWLKDVSEKTLDQKQDEAPSKIDTLSAILDSVPEASDATSTYEKNSNPLPDEKLQDETVPQTDQNDEVALLKELLKKMLN